MQFTYKSIIRLMLTSIFGAVLIVVELVRVSDGHCCYGFRVISIMSSSRRSRPRRAGSSLSSSSSRTISEDQISELLSKLQALLPESQTTRNGAHRGSAARVLQDTCSYIRSLHQEVDNLSETLAELLSSADVTSDQAAVIRSLLM
ncbi:hypothetical protein PR202_gb14181 [Eleusine coracana subsp. coracana]|uniref:BHLH domain-containing protein n=1 Tax=Eleusine coracana subsp. coracana TaxID=191504 RepID=A0AAV5EUR1_ELECO|nr:hypothetical protein PR202_gb14181 [Eleusine coracana subsp. coracana]